ncbi:MAG TPA: nitrate reductase cytochrome c-type subunit; periplasmic nitrate reductase electron transfer subunit [Gammaproteobacteria bacterium]|nr:nitrate reductase cytochrome c-type subunit; periplasmic nitrate reductase electron transfer subunit [Gammaproteobacteria bacterium]
MNTVKLISIAVIVLFATTSALADAVMSMRQTEQLLGSSVVKPAAAYPSSKPGDNKLLKRAYEGAPAQVPHKMDGMVITAKLKKHGCLKCHDRAKAKKKDAPAAPPSHYRDRNGKELKTINMRRLNCTQCHVPQSNAELRVENSFRGTPFEGTLK